MMRTRPLTLGALCALGGLIATSGALATDPVPGVAAGFTAGSPYSFRPLDPYWSYRAMPAAPPRYERLNESSIFMTSINYPGVYGAYTFGVTPTTYYDRPAYFAPAAAPDGFALRTTLTTRGAALAANPQTALINVLVPSDNAVLTFDNTETAPTGQKREFVTPPLGSGGTYVYNVRVKWNDDGVERTRDKNVFVQAGDRLVVDLSTGAGNFEGPRLRTLPMPQNSGPSLRTGTLNP